jgi:DNA-binding GntR family transcriptional regulator
MMEQQDSKFRYREIAQELLHEIQTGELAVGNLLGSESELGTRFGASRGTIRRSLDVLSEAGLIMRRQRSGTRVVNRFPARGLVEDAQLLEDWARYSLSNPLRISWVGEKSPPGDLLPKEQATTKRWLALTGVRYPAGSHLPISYCETFIHPDFAGVKEDLTDKPVPLFALIERRYGRAIEMVQVKLRSVALSTKIAKALQAEPSEPGLQLIRLFMDTNRRVIEIGSNTHPADRYTYQIEIPRAQAP